MALILRKVIVNPHPREWHIQLGLYWQRPPPYNFSLSIERQELTKFITKGQILCIFWIIHPTVRSSDSDMERMNNLLSTPACLLQIATEWLANKKENKMFANLKPIGPEKRHGKKWKKKNGSLICVHERGKRRRKTYCDFDLGVLQLLQSSLSFKQNRESSSQAE